MSNKLLSAYHARRAAALQQGILVLQEQAVKEAVSAVAQELFQPAYKVMAAYTTMLHELCMSFVSVCHILCRNCTTVV